VLLRAKGEGVDVDTGVRGTGVVLERLDGIEVRSLTLGESVLSVKLKLSGNDRVLSPAVHVKGRLSKDEGSGIRKTTSSGSSTISSRNGSSISITEGTVGADEVSIFITKGTDGIRKSVDGIGIIERLSTKSLVEGLSTN
jgi:hypothetical protein